jgi:arylsulfatase A-like enzyme
MFMVSSRVRANGPVVRAGLIAAILIACTDILLGIARSPESWTTASEVVTSGATTCLVSLLAFLGLWYGLAAPLRRRMSLPEQPTLAAVATFLIVVFLQFSVGSGIRATLMSGIQLLATIIILSAGGAIAHSVYVVVRKNRWHQFLSLARRLCRAAPALLLAVVALAFAFNPHLNSLSYAAILLSIAAAAGTVVLFRASSDRAGLILGAIAVGWLAAGATTLYMRDGFFTAMPAGPVSNSHHVPRVILISIDSLRADALSSYNPKSPPTPHIDELASESVTFRRAYGSAAWTLPSTVSLLTGLPTYAHQVYWMTSPLPEEVPTLAGVMAANGYRTSAVVDNPVLDPRLNLFKGFEEYASYPRPWPWAGDAFGRQVLALVAPSKFHRGDTEAVTRTSQQWLRRNRGSDFFFWVHYLDPHAPYFPPARFLPARTPPASIGTSFREHAQVVAGTRMLNAEEREWIRELYLAEVRYVDEQVGLLLGTLKELGLYDDSLIILTSDHGEEFWEHGGYQHGHSMYEEVLAVPLIIKLPGSKTKASVAPRVSTQSVMSTVLDVCGIRPGKSCYSTPPLTGLIANPEDSHHDDVLLHSGSCYQENLDAVIFGDHKLIRRIDSRREELYDLEADPEERRSLLRAAPDLAAFGRRTLTDQSESLKRVRGCYQASQGKVRGLGRDRIEQLRSLGYLN